MHRRRRPTVWTTKRRPLDPPRGSAPPLTATRRRVSPLFVREGLTRRRCLALHRSPRRSPSPPLPILTRSSYVRKFQSGLAPSSFLKLGCGLWGMAMAAAEARLRQEKVKKFEEFIDQRLKPDLVNAIAQREKVFQQQKTFMDLKGNIENLEKNGVTSMRSMVNLGSEARYKPHFCGYWPRFSCGIYLARSFAVYICKGSKASQSNR